MVGYGIYHDYKWTPATPLQELLRVAALVCGSAYLLHLAADFMTSRSLPVIGR